MTNGARSLTVREFLHYYRPDDIDKSRGVYSFVPRSPLLKVIYETPDSNRDWKSRYFFLKGDSWMCHLRDTEHMPVDTTWGILHTSRMHPSFFVCFLFIFFIYYFFFRSIGFNFFNQFWPSFFSVRQCPQVDVEEFSFLEKIFSKTKPEERIWEKLVNLKTIH